MAIIPRFLEMSKQYMRRVPDGVLTTLVIVFACTASFSLGLYAGREDKPHTIEVEQIPLSTALPAAAEQATSARVTGPESEQKVAPLAGGQYVASKKGSKYHFPWCPGAKAMNEANKIWFNSKEEAERAGYTPAANCKGL